MTTACSPNIYGLCPKIEIQVKTKGNPALFFPDGLAYLCVLRSGKDFQCYVSYPNKPERDDHLWKVREGARSYFSHLEIYEVVTQRQVLSLSAHLSC